MNTPARRISAPEPHSVDGRGVAEASAAVRIASTGPVAVSNGDAVKVGDRVRVDRDEGRYPSRGTWPQFRGKSGTVVEINRGMRSGPTEYGVIFGRVRQTEHRHSGLAYSGSPTWFKAEEIVAVSAQGHAERRTAAAVGDGSG